MFNTFYFLLSHLVPTIKHKYYTIHITEKHANYQEYLSIFKQFLLFEENDNNFKELFTYYHQSLSKYHFVSHSEVAK